MRRGPWEIDGSAFMELAARSIVMGSYQLAGRKPTMTTDPDPYEEGQRAARENIPAGGNPYQDGSQEHSLWAAGHEVVAGAVEAGESEGN
jgi:hypothetical protein